MNEKNNSGMQEKIQQLQLMQQSMQQFVMQKQQFQTQLVEVESAIEEIEKTDSAYKIVGNILIKSKKEDLKKDLEHKKKVLDLRIKTIEKQEEQLKDKSGSMQKEVLEGMKKQ